MSDSEEWRFSAISVTKYNPNFRDEDGVYLPNEWTSYSDIGKSYEGKRLTNEAYLESERSYIESVKILAMLFDSVKLELRGLHKFSDSEDFQKRKDQNLEEFYKKLENGYFDSQDLDRVIKLILREYCFGEIVIDHKSNTIVRFGFDYYMYFNSDCDLIQLKENLSVIKMFLN